MITRICIYIPQHSTHTYTHMYTHTNHTHTHTHTSWEKYSHSCRQKSWNSEPYCTLEHQQVKGFKLIWHPYLSPCGTELVQDLVSVLAALASVVGKVGQCFIDHSLDPTSVVEELCDTQSRSINTLSRENGLWIFMSHITFSFFLCWQSRLVYILHNLLPNM